MTLVLTRNKLQEDGIFSTLTDEHGAVLAKTAEHSYNNKPKLTNGTYKCVRSPHRLHGMTSDFETFEITGVSGHSNILYHWGNFPQHDSDGCVLVGDAIKKAVNQANATLMVTNSKSTFAKFMDKLKDVNEFYLIVR